MTTIQTLLQMSGSTMMLDFGIEGENVKIRSSAEGINALAKKFGLFECEIEDIQADFDQTYGPFLHVTLKDI